MSPVDAPEDPPADPPPPDAPDPLDGYRSPFSGETGADNPTVFAGFVIGNSETGGGAFTVTPRIVVQVCTNGMTVKRDALRSIHIGGRMDEGVIRWSDDTNRKTLDLVTAQTRDAVQTFLDVDYVRAKIAELREAAGKPVLPGETQDTIKRVASTLG
ncbi:MAG: hypothetical protein ACOC83_03445, partial [Gemmatimonadota bacterium]